MNGVIGVVDFYEDFCSFLLVLNAMADENELSNACEFLKGISRSFLIRSRFGLPPVFACLSKMSLLISFQTDCTSPPSETSLEVPFLFTISVWTMNWSMRSKCVLIWLVICRQFAF